MLPVSPELVQATVTAIPILLAAWWTVRIAGMAWRASLWLEAGDRLLQAAETLGAEVRPLWNGWEVHTPTGSRIQVRGGLQGHQTRVVRQGERARVLPGVPPAAELSALIPGGPTAPGSP